MLNHEELAKKYSVSVEEVKKLEAEQTEELKQKNNMTDVDKLAKFVPKRVTQILAGYSKSGPLDLYQGGIVGIDKAKDTNEGSRNKIKRLIAEKKAELIKLNMPEDEIKKCLMEEGLINEKGELLKQGGFDKKETVLSSEPNFVTKYIVYAKRKEEDEPFSLFGMEIWGEDANKEMESMVLCEFNSARAKTKAGVEKEMYGLPMLANTKRTSFKKTGGYLPAQVMDDIKTKYAKFVKTIEELHEIATLPQRDYNEFYIVNASMVYGSLYTLSPKTNIVRIEDDSMEGIEITGFLAKNSKISFADGALDCWVFCNPSTVAQNKKRNETDPDISVNVLGVWADDGFRPPEDEPESVDKEEVVEKDEAPKEAPAPKKAPAPEPSSEPTAGFETGNDDEEDF